MKSRVPFASRQLPLFAIISILLFSFSAFAQSDMPGATSMGNGGQNTIQGDIITPNGQRLDRPVIVRLNTIRGELTTTSNSNGSFAFRNLAGGRYVVRVEVEGYTPATETVDIPHPQSSLTGSQARGQNYSVQLYLRPGSGAAVTKGVVSANDPPKPALDLYNKALESVKAGERDKAIEHLKAALAIHPNFPAALNGLGVQYMKLGNYQSAYEAFNTALTITPDSFILHLNCGITLFQLNKFAEAEKEFSAALLKNEASGAAHIYRARALIALNRLDDAVKDLKRAVAIGGDDVKIAHRFLAGIYIEKGENAEAVKELELYLKTGSAAKETDQIKNLIKELNKKGGRE
jgi:tetratricopeptide (TPR) repeat protein